VTISNNARKDVGKFKRREIVEMGNPYRHDRYTEAEFIALARVNERRLELWDGEIMDMTYSTPETGMRNAKSIWPFHYCANIW
jgi:hypothetical protein